MYVYIWRIRILSASNKIISLIKIVLFGAYYLVCRRVDFGFFIEELERAMIIKFLAEPRSGLEFWVLVAGFLIKMNNSATNLIRKGGALQGLNLTHE